jgi:hypothetical protein
MTDSGFHVFRTNVQNNQDDAFLSQFAPAALGLAEQSRGQIRMGSEKVRFCKTIKFEPFLHAVAIIDSR